MHFQSENAVVKFPRSCADGKKQLMHFQIKSPFSNFAGVVLKVTNSSSNTSCKQVEMVSVVEFVKLVIASESYTYFLS